MNRELVLPGVGSFVAVAVKAADARALGWAVVTMVILIVTTDTLFWRPLVAWAEKFKVEESQAAAVPTSGVLNLLRRSHLLSWLESRLAGLDDALLWRWRRWRGDQGPALAMPRGWRVAATIVVWVVLGALVLRGIVFVGTGVAGSEVVRVVGFGAMTLLRVVAVVAMAALVWTPIGVWIGLNPRVARPAQPIVQVLASFPANFLFPLVTIVFVRLGLSLEWAAPC
jgi:NitT/TauT family transport system permease protein